MISPSDSRPDLEEFFGALGGFLKEETPPSDLSYQKFVGVFCRSIGAPQGHIVKPAPSGELESVHAFGLDSSFSDAFNNLSKNGDDDPSPIHRSYANKQVIAIADMNKDPRLPAWFRSLMNQQGFHSLVAIPLMGRSKMAGVLCAYYHDVCLFDQGTLDHLLMIGRMVGSALDEKPVPLPPSKSASSDDFSDMDRFLESLLRKPLQAVQIIEEAARFAKAGVGATGLVSGRIQKKDADIFISFDAGSGFPATMGGKELAIPPFLRVSLLSGSPTQLLPSKTMEEWGAFRPFITGRESYGLISPIGWGTDLKGAVVAWRCEAVPFTFQDGLFLKRIGAIVSLALRNVPSV